MLCLENCLRAGEIVSHTTAPLSESGYGRALGRRPPGGGLSKVKCLFLVSRSRVVLHGRPRSRFLPLLLGGDVGMEAGSPPLPLPFSPWREESGIRVSLQTSL